MLKKYFGEVKGLYLSEKLLLALAFSLPFERIPTFDISGLTIKPSLLIGVILIIVSGYRTAKNPKSKKHRLNPVSVAPYLLLSYSLLSFFWSVDTTAWLKSNLVLGFVVLLFYEVWRVIIESKSAKKLLSLVVQAIFLSTLVIIGFGFFQWFGDLLGLPASITGIRTEYTAIRLGLPRMHSVLLEPLYFSLFLLLPLGMSLADRKNELFKNLTYRVGFITLIYLSILLSLARGAIVSSIIMGFIAYFYNFSELKKQLDLRSVFRYLGVFALLFVAIITAVSLFGKKGTDDDNNYSKGIGTLTGHLETIRPWGNAKDKADNNSINSRDVARQEAKSVLSKGMSNKLFGVGAGQYGANLSPAKDSNATSNFVALDVWVQYGLIGLSILVVFGLSLVFKTNWRDTVSFGLVLYLIGFGIQSITFGELGITHLWFVLAILAAKTEFTD